VTQVTTKVRSRAARLRFGAAPILAALAIILAFVPDAAALLELRTGDSVWAQPWRLITGHLLHWSPEHLFWDVIAFTALGILWERRRPAAFLGCVLASALAVSLAMPAVYPSLTAYRGLSGIDAALFVGLAVAVSIDAWRAADRVWLLTGLACLTAFVCKLAYEFAADDVLFAGLSRLGVVPLPMAHVVGGLVGAIFARSLADPPRTAGSYRNTLLIESDASSGSPAPPRISSPHLA